MPLTPKEMIRLLEKNGFIHIKSNNGSHQKYFNPKTNVTVIIPLHSRELGKGLEQAILKLAGLKR
ncbi:MAG: type II toxin-antitoxin system HicA family toxin [Phascolarctobacterium sp.]|nr:type II toxin-antitoxin system HicA family toxin [Phascolarctobacterium sp.]